MRETSQKVLKLRRSVATGLIMVLVITFGLYTKISDNTLNQPETSSDVLAEKIENGVLAVTMLEELEVKGRAPKSGYTRSEFGNGWALIQGCDMRNRILKVSMSDIKIANDGCVVLSGILQDPYTDKTINFVRGQNTSDDVQIDHVVALSDAWQKGAQFLETETRESFANDSLNLLAVDGDANQQKGDSDAASWLPSNKSFRCRYVARQIAVKKKYNLWVTEAEKSVMKRILNGCRAQVVPVER
jgi:hypothetical protein